MSTKRKTYTTEYKLEAIRLALREGSSVKQTADALGIPEHLLYKWVRAYKAQGESGTAFPGKGVISRDEEIYQLRRELKRITEERDFLKKTAAFFARDTK